jgi:N-glycosylase/DNA lyase
VPSTFEIPMRGPAGEPVDLHRTLESHGTFSLPPADIVDGHPDVTTTLPVAGARPRAVRITRTRGGRAARVAVAGPEPGRRTRAGLEAVVRRVLNLEEDLSGFYAVAAEDPDLSWVARGAGRMVRSPTVFEDVVKTLTTTNCSWALTTRMVTALVAELGEPAAGVAPEGWRGRAFPTAEAMADRPERFYREVVKAGYRAPHFVSLSRAVATGALDLESLLDPALTDEEVEERLLALPGIGPYAAAHVQLTLGRYGKLILDGGGRAARRAPGGPGRARRTTSR